MNPILQEKINKLKQQEKEAQDKRDQEKLKAEIFHQQKIESKIPEAKIWIEEKLLDLIAQEDRRLEAINSSSHIMWSGEKKRKEMHLSPPENIPVESVVKALNDFEGFKTRWVYIKESHDNDSGQTYAASTEYFVQW